MRVPLILGVAIACVMAGFDLAPAHSQTQQTQGQAGTDVRLQAPRPWPPIDASGRPIHGPKRSGTREEIGWPMYGWSAADKARYMAGENL